MQTSRTLAIACAMTLVCLISCGHKDMDAATLTAAIRSSKHKVIGDPVLAFEVLEIQQAYPDARRSPDDKGTTYSVRGRLSRKDGTSSEADAKVFIAASDGFLEVNFRAPVEVSDRAMRETEAAAAEAARGAEIAGLKAKIDALSRENTKLAEQVWAQTLARTDSDKAVAGLTKEIAPLRDNLARATSALELVKATLKADQDTIKGLQEEIARLRAGQLPR